MDNIFDLGDKDAEAIMTPRTDVICLDMEDSLEENLETVVQLQVHALPGVPRAARTASSGSCT